MKNDINEITKIINNIDQSRIEMKKLVDNTDPDLEICPGWTIKEVLGHLTGWEIAIHKALMAFLSGDSPYFMHEQDFDLFNRSQVEKRATWSFDETLKEWETVRENLKGTIAGLKVEDLDQEMVLPWGSERPVIELIEIISEHEDEHREAVIKKKC